MIFKRHSGRNRNHKNCPTSRRQNSPRLSHGLPIFDHMLENVTTVDCIEGSVREWNTADIQLKPPGSLLDVCRLDRPASVQIVVDPPELNLGI
jgi:hypothetical protein